MQLPDAADVTSRPTTPCPASEPSIWMSAWPLLPGSVVPSIVTGWVSAGKAESRLIVWTPLPGISKSIALPVPVVALELMIAWRSEPAPLSLVLVTVKLESIWRPSRSSRSGRRRSAARRCDR